MIWSLLFLLFVCYFATVLFDNVLFWSYWWLYGPLPPIHIYYVNSVYILNCSVEIHLQAEKRCFCFISVSFVKPYFPFCFKFPFTFLFSSTLLKPNSTLWQDSRGIQQMSFNRNPLKYALKIIFFLFLCSPQMGKVLNEMHNINIWDME